MGLQAVALCIYLCLSFNMHIPSTPFMVSNRELWNNSISVQTMEIDTQRSAGNTSITLHPAAVDTQRRAGNTSMTLHPAAVDTQRRAGNTSMTLHPVAVDTQRRAGNTSMTLHPVAVDTQRRAGNTSMTLHPVAVDTQRRAGNTSMTLHPVAVDTQRRAGNTSMTLHPVAVDTQRRAGNTSMTLHPVAVDTQRRAGNTSMTLHPVAVDTHRGTWNRESQEPDNITYTTPQSELGYHIVPVLPDMDTHTLLVYVMCRPDLYERRRLIRDTWGNHSLFYKDGLKQLSVFFTLGLTNFGNGHRTNFENNQTTNKEPGNKERDHSVLHQAIIDESGLFHDILLLDMYDNYDNLTLKGLMTMRWIMKHTSVSHMLKVDEDMMVNPFGWIHLTKELTKHRITCCVTGQPFTGSHPTRKGKYGVSRESYPSDNYPNYLHGPTYMLTRDAMAAILEMSEHVTERFRLEDVYFLAILGNQAGVSVLGLPGKCFLLNSRLSPWQQEPMLWIHRASASVVHHAWTILQREGQSGSRKLLKVKDISSHGNVRQLLPERWLLKTNTTLHHNCQPRKTMNLDVRI